MRIQPTYVALLACLAFSLCSTTLRACPDICANGNVDVDDLLVVINAWGPCPAPPAVCKADIAPDTGNGVVNVDDLVTIINAWGTCPTGTTTVLGFAQLSDGTPVQDAVVASALGGQGVSDAKGAFQFDVMVPSGATSLNLTALATINSINYAGSAVVTNIVPGASSDAGIITLNTQSATPTCDQLSWLPTFGPAPGFNGEVRGMAVFDDGSGGGPALYVSGSFTTIFGMDITGIAKFDGSSWSAVGAGQFSGFSGTMTVFDDGSGGGPALYVGGTFPGIGLCVGKWDGKSWTQLGGPMSALNNGIHAMAVFDDGSGDGPELYVGGGFITAGGVTVNRITKWNGSAWTKLGTGMNSEVLALTVFDDGSGGGPALYAGGGFSNAGGVVANKIARWNGTSWSNLRGGVMPPSSAVFSLLTFDDGSGAGPALYVGGAFTFTSGIPVNNIARWNGTSWSSLGSGIGGGVSGIVYDLTIFDDGSGDGPALYAAGDFTTAGGASANRIAKWNGTTWSALGSGTDAVINAVAVFDDGSGSGPVLYAVGDFFTAGDVGTVYIAKWDGLSWSAFSSGFNRWVFATAVFDDGTGPALYAGGVFTTTGEVSAKYIAKWDGSSWSPLGSGLSGGTLGGGAGPMLVFDDGLGDGPALIVVGDFTSAGGVSANGIAKWNGTSWSALGTGLPGIHALAVFDDGSGPALYAGGSFTNKVAKWNGSSWSAVGGGVGNNVLAMTVFDDGLYVGGYLESAGGVSANHIAKWDGSSWSALGGGTNGLIHELAVFDDGSGYGPALYAGGNFGSAGGLIAPGIAKWNGCCWSPLAEGLLGDVRALAVFDDGSGVGPALYAGGWFTTAGGSANGIAKWDGSTWSALGSGLEGVQTIAVFDDGSGGGPALYAGGFFFESPAGDSFLAKWGCPAAK